MVDYQTGLSSRHGSFCSSTLREPDFHDFLNLSDDDIAEAAPESLDPPYSEDSPQRLPSMGLAITSAKPRPTSLLTLTTQRATHVATAAAFEAARIAKRYDFDLVYVVNLWPNRPGHRSTPSGSSVKTCASEHGTTSQRPLVGKLLAAHGLHHVPTPLQISSSVHSTILRKDGWVEYRNSLAEESDLARGYACAFHKGQYNSKAGILDAGTPVSGVRLSEKIDRGIVFAAYRKPRHDESRRLGTDLKQDELRQLHEDAEALVEMVLDIHVTNRSRLPLTPTQLADDIGPIPSEQTKLEDIWYPSKDIHFFDFPFLRQSHVAPRGARHFLYRTQRRDFFSFPFFSFLFSSFFSSSGMYTEYEWTTGYVECIISKDTFDDGNGSWYRLLRLGVCTWGVEKMAL
jgi:hypothetical protein